MFSFRKDKAGFFFGLALIIICGGTFIATLVLFIVGACLGNYQMFLWPIRWVLAGWWLACVATVLARVYVRNWQMHQPREQHAQPSSPTEPAQAVTQPPLSPEAEVARALADQERYRAIGTLGVATVLGVASALVIVSLLSTVVQDQSGAMPVQIVAWSVGGGVILVVVILCVIAMRRRDYLPWLPGAAPRQPASTGVQKSSPTP
jgi:hypothetical protein